MTKENIEVLLEKCYDKRRSIRFRIDFYEKQLLKTPSLKYIYSAWIRDDEQALQDLDVEIQYYQYVLKSD